MPGSVGGPQSGFDVTEFFWLLLIASVVSMLGRRFKVPYAIALVITGLLVGAPHLLPEAHLEPHTLFTVFLPPLLFESAIHLRIDALRRDARAIAIYALGGTLLSTFVVGGLSVWTLDLPWKVALVFGALISTTDPISVVAVVKRLGVGPRLSLLVEAESLFNDGASVVIFGLLLELASGGAVSAADGVQRFLIVVIGGAGIGGGIGALASRVTREFDDHLLEIMLTTVVAFGAYLCAESVHVSGVIAVVVAGLVVGNYGMPTGMSPTTRLAVASFWEYAAFVVNSLVFLLLGMEVTLVNLWANVGPVLVAIVTVLVGRAVAIYLLSPLVNALGGAVPSAWRHVLFWGGLRGALSIALALGLGPRFPYRDRLVVLTFGVVLFSLLAQGLTFSRLLRRLGLTGGPSKAAEYRRLSSEGLACHAALREVEGLAHRGALPRVICEEVAEDYRGRLRELEQQVAGLHLSQDGLKEQQTAEARRVALLAEKIALQEADREGLLDEDQLRELVERIDNALAVIQAERNPH